MGCQCSRNVERSDPSQRVSNGGSHSATLNEPQPHRDIRDYYKLGPILGSGSFGQVRLCLHRKTEQQFACKIMAKNPGRHRKGSDHHPVNLVHMFRNEIDILQRLDHPNVVKLVEVFEDKHFLYAIMEKCEGGELFTRIFQKRKFAEVEASRLCSEMLAAIAYIHSRDIIHRDIKAENFLFNSAITTTSSLVLIDFGMSVRLTEPDRYLKQVCGSPHYVAPELIKRSYRKEVDLWALGVVMFLMLYGRYPFEGSDQKQIAQRILKSEPDYARTSTPPSESAIHFIKCLLEKDPVKRMTPEGAMNHPWLRNPGPTFAAAVGSSSMPVSSSRKLSSCGSRRADRDCGKMSTAAKHQFVKTGEHSSRAAWSPVSLLDGPIDEDEESLHHEQGFMVTGSEDGRDVDAGGGGGSGTGDGDSSVSVIVDEDPDAAFDQAPAVGDWESDDGEADAVMLRQYKAATFKQRGRPHGGSSLSSKSLKAPLAEALRREVAARANAQLLHSKYNSHQVAARRIHLYNHAM